eukprot:3877986-Pyramimonas_sp.AAC.1
MQLLAANPKSGRGFRLLGLGARAGARSLRPLAFGLTGAVLALPGLVFDSQDILHLLDHALAE